MHPRTLDPRTLGEAAGRGSTRDDGASTTAATAALTAALLLADLRQSGSGTASGDDDDCARGAVLARASVDVNPCVAVKSDSLLRDRSIFAGGSSLWHSGFRIAVSFGGACRAIREVVRWIWKGWVVAVVFVAVVPGVKGVDDYPNAAPKTACDVWAEGLGGTGNWQQDAAKWGCAKYISSGGTLTSCKAECWSKYSYVR